VVGTEMTLELALMGAVGLAVGAVLGMTLAAFLIGSAAHDHEGLEGRARAQHRADGPNCPFHPGAPIECKAKGEDVEYSCALCHVTLLLTQGLSK